MRGLAIIEVEARYPGLPRVEVERVFDCGHLVVAEWAADYVNGRPYLNVSLVEVREGKVLQTTEYFGAPFDPPEYRRHLVEIKTEAGPAPE
ncbi:MAG: hypothetical protein ACRDVM_03115 [Acidimicrobiia bacterium]